MPTNVENAAATLRGTRLFVRQLNLTLGFPKDPNLDINVKFNEQNSTGLDISGLDVDFQVDKSLKPTEPNTCAIKVYDMAPASRQALSGAHSLSVRLEAGYVGGISQLYFAEARSAWTTANGPTYITHIESTDTVARPTAVKRTRKAPIGSATGNLYRTLGPKVPLETAFRQIAQALGIGEGNLQQALSNIHGAPITAVSGSALLGNGARRMTDICRSAGLEWSVQDGQLQLINIGQVLSTIRAVELNSGTGLIGSPSVDSQGALTLTTLLIPGIVPGVLINVDSLFVSGGYRVEKCRYVGSTRDKDWYIHMDAVRY